MMDLFIDNLDLVKRVYYKFYRTTGLMNQNDIDDLIQEGNIGLWEASMSYKFEIGQFRNYASKVIFNKMYMYVNRTMRKQNNIDVKEYIEDIYKHDYSILYVKEALEEVSKIINKRQYKILLMYIEGITQVDISKILNISISTVNREFRVAKQAISDVLGVENIKKNYTREQIEAMKPEINKLYLEGWTYKQIGIKFKIHECSIGKFIDSDIKFKNIKRDKKDRFNLYKKLKIDRENGLLLNDLVDKYNIPRTSVHRILNEFEGVA